MDNSSVSIRDGFRIVLVMQLTFVLVLVLEKWRFFDGFSAAPDAVLGAIRSSQLCAILIEDQDDDEGRGRLKGAAGP
jgi:hypothetical protein